MTCRSRDQRGGGQSLAEFALVLPVFFLLLGGVIRFGLIFCGQNTLNQVVRDTGRWAASQTTCSGASDVTKVIATANAIAANSSLIGYTSPWTGSDVTVAWTGDTTPTCPPANNKKTAWVTITITHRVPIFFPGLPGNGNISSTTQFRMEPLPS
jgi:Flp pilus assembly protein TadG